MMPTMQSVRLSLPLGYQQEIFQEVHSEDRLVVLARGLGLLQVVTNFLHSYDAAGGCLVVLIGASEREIEWIGEALTERSLVSKFPHTKGLQVLNADLTTLAMRQTVWAQGGICAVSSRILITDLLTKLLAPHTITGIVVLHAERVIATSLEAFVLRIYRQHNKAGFVKAFSDNPESFASGFSPLAAMMRNLHLRIPSLWPRFHMSVAYSLENKKADVIELTVSMTPSMKEIQTALLQCIEISISEVRKGSANYLDIDEWNVDNTLHATFDVLVRRQLDPVWHLLSPKTKQIVGDLKSLRALLDSLILYDCVSFLQSLEALQLSQPRHSESPHQNQSLWLLSDPGEIVFRVARTRVLTGKISKGDPDDSISAGVTPVLEEQPKWGLLSQVLDEIERDTYLSKGSSDDSYGTVLIMCANDDIVHKQVKEYLATMCHNLGEGDTGEYHTAPSAASMLLKKFRQYLIWKHGFSKAAAGSAGYSHSPELIKRPNQVLKGRPSASKRRRIRGGIIGVSACSSHSNEVSNVKSAIEALRAGTINKNQKPEIGADTFERLDDYFGLLELQDAVIVHPFSGDMDDRLLEETRPKYIIMFNPDPSFIRRIEVYRSSHQDRKVKVYFLYYGDSVEEQRFLSTVRREKDAFSKIIKEKGSMAVTITAEGDVPHNAQELYLRIANTRVAGGGRLSITPQQPRVIVDAREFRSTLPSLLHQRGIEVVPCTLTVGDYIITPNMCVERKSIKDLITSFNNGRLFTQCEAMLLHYRTPMVLIEFDVDKSFTLEQFFDTASASVQNDLQSKLALLALTFPRIKFIWSSSPFQSAEIFEEIKKSHDEPDPTEAVKLGLEEGDDPLDSGNRSQDLLRAIPGISLKNYRQLTSTADSIVELSHMEQGHLTTLVGLDSAKKVHRFFNRVNS